MKEDKLGKIFNKCLKFFHVNISEKNEKLLLQIFKFVIVGGTATILDWIIYYICYNFFHIEPLIANIISFTISVIYNYIASVTWVFDVNKEKSKVRIFIEFIIFSILGFLLSEFLLWLGIHKLGLNAMLVKILSTIIVMVFNFVTRKIFLEK